ncbi:hypothetical protein AAVH_42546, partial [Aphelenchoides avenae]
PIRGACGTSSKVPSYLSTSRSTFGAMPTSCGRLPSASRGTTKKGSSTRRITMAARFPSWIITDTGCTSGRRCLSYSFSPLRFG